MYSICTEIEFYHLIKWLSVFNSVIFVLRVALIMWKGRFLKILEFPWYNVIISVPKVKNNVLTH